MVKIMSLFSKSNGINYFVIQTPKDKNFDGVILLSSDKNVNVIVGYLKKEPTFLITKNLDNNSYKLMFSLDKKMDLSLIEEYSRLRDAKRGAERFVKKIEKLFN